MKRFLALLAVTCFALAAWGQQTALVGLPEIGVTLTGTPAEPTIVNNSGRTARFLRLDQSADGGIHMQMLNTRGIRLQTGDYKEGILAGATSVPLSTEPGMPSPPIISHGENPDVNPVPVIKATLEAVVSADGQFVGPASEQSEDEFADMADRLIAEQELAALVSAARKDPTKREAAWADYRIFNSRLALSRADR